MRFALLSLAVCGLLQGQATALLKTMQRVREMTVLGRQIFFDPALSASGRMSCASCHDPRFAYGPPNGLAVQLGGADMKEPGRRVAPSLRYLQAVPQFSEHYFDSDVKGDDSVDNGPTGGLTWDGRVDRARDQARLPLLSPFEMANGSSAEVVAKARRAPYWNELNKLARGKPFETILEALETFEQDPAEFYPYSSKYDDFLAGKAELNPAELRGLKLFMDPSKGNCSRCHVATRGANGTPPQLTDYGLVAIGVPRNAEIPANADPSYLDLGMCGPERTDLKDRSEFCGRFMTPTLRNAALRRAFFHNGTAHTLREAVAFYVERDTKAGGRKFDDLPDRYRGNVDNEPPFGPQPDNRPVLSSAEIDDVVAFIGTLTDRK